MNKVDYSNARTEVIFNLDDPELKKAFIYAYNQEVGQPNTTWRGAKVSIYELLKTNLYVAGRNIIGIDVRKQSAEKAFEKACHLIKWDMLNADDLDALNIKGTFEQKYQQVYDLPNERFVEYLRMCVPRPLSS